MDVAIMIEGQAGLTWARWERLAQAAEELGYAGLYRSDHFTNASGPNMESLEMWASFTWLATQTERIEFGPMVSPVSFRNPVVTAWTAAAVDDLSGGRLWLGMGAGWQEREHREYGFDLLDLDARFRRFEEGLQVVSALLRSDVPTSMDGEFYHLEDALLLPRPARAGGPPIVIGGNGPKRTIPLAARYADEWNAVYVTADGFRERCAELDRHATAAGRNPSDIRRTLMHRVILAADTAALDAELANDDRKALDERGVIYGTPDEVTRKLLAFRDAGVQRVMAQWLDLDDIAGLELLAREVLPALAG